jgi:hypothetical protein
MAINNELLVLEMCLICTDHKDSYKFCIKYIYILIIRNMATVRMFEIKYDKFNIGEICTNGNYMLR